ncbi:DNA helicase [Billgrantia pellis]|uniref:DNA helicase n=1 Tax=Billgrantia pellis TaxID=2606936 RepID=A0A7V7G3E3_9GAMM|nr:cory-CC-star protein [Halomonas pellis]KAA0014535.1 DNA helicase [Halomonas pellis]
MNDDHGEGRDPRLERVRAWLSQARFFAEEIYSARYRGAVARARRDEDDLFMLLVFSDMMGVPNPAAYYTLELQPLLLERFHDWHKRMGMERSPLEHFRCC